MNPGGGASKVMELPKPLGGCFFLTHWFWTVTDAIFATLRQSRLNAA